jgi:hypothetical protein
VEAKTLEQLEAAVDHLDSELAADQKVVQEQAKVPALH